MTIFNVQFRGASAGSFTSIDVPFDTLEDFVGTLTTEEVIFGEALLTHKDREREHARVIHGREAIAIHREGYNFIRTTSYSFTEDLD